jgi:hypothetical protein
MVQQERFQITAIVHCGDIDQHQYSRTHCNYEEYMDIDFMSSNLLKNILYSGSKPNSILSRLGFS